MMEKDLLFCLQAVSLGLAGKGALAEARRAVAPGAAGLRDELVRRCQLGQAEAELVDRAVELVLKVHHDDVQAAIGAVGGAFEVAQSALDAVGLASTLAAGDQGTAATMASSETAKTLGHEPGPRVDATLAHSGPAGVDGVPPDAAITLEAQNRYQVRGEVGRGGIGKVLVAFDEHVGREVAVKELLIGPRTGSTSEGTVGVTARFLREARLTAQLEHPSIVPVYEVGRREDGTLYYAMRLVRGRTLAQALHDCRGIEERLEYLPHFANLCAAVAFAHSRGVLHRDLKPHNVMIGEFNETVLLDWGLAKLKGATDREDRRFTKHMEALREVASGKTVEGAALGTPEYMPPEQAWGDLDRVDEHSDVYSLGAVLYELLTGHPPFTGARALEILSKVQRYGEGKQGLPPVKSQVKNAPPELAAVAHKALYPQPHGRYQSAKALLEEINAFTSGGKVSAYRYSAREELRRFVRKNRGVAALALALFVVLVVGSALMAGLWRDARAAERRVHWELAVGYREKAARLAAEKDYLGARILAAAALEESPFNPLGRYADPSSFGTPHGDEMLASLQSTLWTATEQGLAHHTASLEGHEGSVEVVRFSPDGKLLATAGVDRTVRVWSVADRKQLQMQQAAGGSIAALAWSPDGATLAFGGAGKVVSLWQLSSQAAPVELAGHKDSVTSIAFSSDGKRLASSSRDRTIRLWDVASRSELSVLSPPPKLEGFPERITFSPDGARLAVTGFERELLLYDASGSLETTVHGGEGYFLGAVWARNGRKLWALGSDRTVRSYDPLSAEEVEVFSLGGGQPKGLAARFDETGAASLLAVGHYETIELWDATTGERLDLLHGHGGQVRTVHFAPDGRTLASGGLDHRVHLWEIAKGPGAVRLTGHTAQVTALAVSADGARLLSGSKDQVVKLWDLPSRRAIATWEGHSSDVLAAAFLPDGSPLTAGRDGAIKLWERQGTGLRATMSATDPKPISAISVSPDGALVASADGDGKVRLWDVGRREVARLLDGHAESSTAVAFSPDGRTLASGGRDKAVRLWDVATGRALSTWTLPDRVRSVAWSSDGRLVAVSDQSWTISLFEAATSALVATLKGHHDAPRSLGFSRDGRMLVSAGSADMTVRLWEVPSGRLLQVMDLRDETRTAALLPDGRSLVAGYGELLVLAPVSLELWKKDPAAMLEEAQRDASMKLDGFTLLPR